ncbi:uncharacterized protein PRCAT00005690001 [Priceomyces carsonii]|uniref:uncharacterized protein n=1 Tax=Priceomyces carsonii TaxID=28549 RepID=UPI002ED8B175|nr:unnamed protein product [Priceomyces carsonii]
MVFITLSKIKLFLSTFLLFYVTYLYTYKCEKLAESPLEHGVQQVFHPLSHSHNVFCDALSKFEKFSTPYVESGHAFLDKNVHSHHLFIEYKIGEKLQVAKEKYYQFVYPVLLKIFEYFEVVEYHVSEHVIETYGKLKALYEEKVAK